MRKLASLALIFWFVTLFYFLLVGVSYQINEPRGFMYLVLSLYETHNVLVVLISSGLLVFSLVLFILSLSHASVLYRFFISFNIATSITFVTLILTLPFLKLPNIRIFSDIYFVQKQEMFKMVALFGAMVLVSNLIFIINKRYRMVGILLLFYFLLISIFSFTYTELMLPKSVDISSTPTELCDVQATLKSTKNCTYLVSGNSSHGTGFSITQNGYLVTNYHVVEDSNGNLDVWYGDQFIKGRLVGFSIGDDIAIIKVNASTDACEWAESSNLDLAESVYAIGWPNDPNGESTVTKGVFSRFVEFSDSPRMIQTDTPINPGNSGGPLINACGVIGVNTSKVTWINEVDPSEGIGYAIPSNYVKLIVDKIISEDNGNVAIPTSSPFEDSNIDVDESPKYKRTDQKVAYDYNEVLFWEQRKANDLDARESWKSALNSEFYDAEKLSRLLTILDRLIVISEDLWDGYTNSNLTFGEVEKLRNEYGLLSSESATLSRELNYEGEINSYNSCISSWEDLEKEYNKDFSEQKDKCEEILN